jgi:hypothetical protein
MRDYARNIEHADNPRVGDYWHEMFTPICRVMIVTDTDVLVQKFTGHAGEEITDTHPPPELMPRSVFAAWLRYDTMSDKTWVDVVPEKFRELSYG